MITDDSLMPEGPYKGRVLSQVPDKHLLEIKDECCPELREYILENMDAILFNIKREEEDPLNYKPKNFYDEQNF